MNRKSLKKMVSMAPVLKRRTPMHVTPGKRPQLAPSRSGARKALTSVPASPEVEVVEEAAFVEGGADAGAHLAVAEMEAAVSDDEEGGGAVEVEEVEPVVAAKSRDDEPANFLALYFREMAELSVLRPEQEFETAREIEQLEIELWVHLLTNAEMTEAYLAIFEKMMENSLVEFKALRRIASDCRRRPTAPGLERFNVAALAAAERIRALDLDKRALAQSYDELVSVARVVHGHQVDFATNTKQFRDYCKKAMALNRRIHLAKNEFVKANLRLVVSIARRFNHGRMALSDLIQEGNIGLMKAVERYDYRRGYRFSTYASWWIRHAISRALADKGRAVRLPVHMIDAYHRVAKSKRELTGKLGRQPTSEEVGEATGIAAVKIEKMRTFLLDQSFSLDRTVSDDDGRKFIDFIADPNAEVEPTERLTDEATTVEMRRLLHELKPIEADILRRRFGLDNDQELTLKEIGEKYNLSRERIRQLQEQALLKMRRALQRKELM